MARYMLVATMKDEGVNVFDWVAYHRSIGFTDIVVYENSSFDLTRRQLRLMDQLGLITYFTNEMDPARFPNGKPPYQNRAYNRSAKLDLYKEVDWCMMLDGDEFLNIHVGDGTVSDLVAAHEGMSQIQIQWAVFGCSNQTEIVDESYLKAFTYNNTGDPNRRISAFNRKTMFRTDHYGRPGIHLPKDANLEKIRGTKSVNHFGQIIDSETEEVLGTHTEDPFALAQVNHYVVRDAKSFLMSRVRGSSSNVGRDVGLSYWIAWNWNSTHDISIQRHYDRMMEEKERMDALDNGRLGFMQARCRKLWNARVNELLEDEKVQEDFDLMLKIRPKVGVPRRFIRGPDCARTAQALQAGSLEPKSLSDFG